MICKIEHVIEYCYSNDVGFSPHLVRMIPKSDAYVSLLEFSIAVEPEPEVKRIFRYHDGSIFCNMVFSEKSKFMKISSISKVKMDKYNPYEFIIFPLEYCNIPFTFFDYELKENFTFYDFYIDSSVFNYAWSIAENSKFMTIDFLDALLKKIHDEIVYQFRESGMPFSSELTLENKKGSCRDITALFIACCRSLKIPSRFVSGYYLSPQTFSGKEILELHSWAEVYVPGAGWIGYDPTNGVLCCGQHLSVTSSFIYKKTLPVEGNVIGNATSSMNYSLKAGLI